VSHGGLQVADSRRTEALNTLEGNWRQELLFVLQQEVDMYDRLPETDRRVRSGITETLGSFWRILFRHRRKKEAKTKEGQTKQEQSTIPPRR